MGWHMKLVICVQLAYVSVCLTREMSVVREWTSLDLQLISEHGQESRWSIERYEIYSWVMYKDRMFITQINSLAYLDLTDNSTPMLFRPYPGWETLVRNANRQIAYIPDIVRVDRCDRLWLSVMCDRDNPDLKNYFNMTVFDLKTDSILRNIFIPDLTYSYDMTFDDFDCDNEYVYISNAKGVWTYSWADGDSWHHISYPIYSMILAPNSIVYYNVGIEPMVYYMSTTHLRDKCNKTIDIKELGPSRKLNVNLASSALDAKSDVLYYFNDDNSTVIHAIPCWTSERCCTNCHDVSIDPTHKLRYITVDENGYLWAITSRSSFEDGEINYRLLSVPVKSTCIESNANDTTATTSTDVEPNAKDTTNTTNINEITTAASSTTEQTTTLGSVPKHTTVNIADTTAGTPNSNITQVIGGTNMPYLLFSFTNNTFNFNLSNFTIRY